MKLADTKEVASGIDKRKPAEFKMSSTEVLNRLADMMNIIEEGAEWPKQMNVPRAACTAKEEGNALSPTDYRVLLMMPAAYRPWAKTRLRHLQPWMGEWATPDMFSGVAQHGAEGAAYLTALAAELCTLTSRNFSGAGPVSTLSGGAGCSRCGGAVCWRWSARSRHGKPR